MKLASAAFGIMSTFWLFGCNENPGNEDRSPGTSGQDGSRGSDGEQGATGRDGRDGAQGAAGPMGPQGPKGEQGPPGESVVGPQGPEGPVGPMGPAGPQGHSIVGPQGPQGLRGLPGEPGTSLTADSFYMREGASHYFSWAKCDVGDVVISGGCSSIGHQMGVMTFFGSAKSDNNVDTYDMYKCEAATTVNAKLRAHAVCMRLD